MPLLSKPTSAAGAAVAYITVGTLMMVWTAVWYYTHRPLENTQIFWIAGFFFTGLTLTIIGITIGRIGRAARRAELPPPAPSTPTSEPANAAPPQQSAAVNAPTRPMMGPAPQPRLPPPRGAPPVPPPRPP